MMIPYSIGLMIAGLLMTVFWVVLQLPLGPGAISGYTLP
jgi:aminobenzoyl-glutamate transport protein